MHNAGMGKTGEAVTGTLTWQWNSQVPGLSVTMSASKVVPAKALNWSKKVPEKLSTMPCLQKDTSICIAIPTSNQKRFFVLPQTSANLKASIRNSRSGSPVEIVDIWLATNVGNVPSHSAGSENEIQARCNPNRNHDCALAFASTSQCLCLPEPH